MGEEAYGILLFVWIERRRQKEVQITTIQYLTSPRLTLLSEETLSMNEEV